jgi:hypothetical protein
MPLDTTPTLVAVVVLFAVIALAFVKIIPRVMGKQCPKCLRRVPQGQAICPACGATVTAKTDLGR